MSKPHFVPVSAAALCAALSLTACGQPGERAWRSGAPKAPADPESVAGYLRPPSLTSSRIAGGQLLLQGKAQPGAQVRLISPNGAMVDQRADDSGGWTARLPASAEARLFAVSMAAGGDRVVPAQGVLVLLPDGRAVQLRAGASAEPIGVTSQAPRLLTIDFDADGAASVAGVARPQTGVSLRIDRVARGAGQTDSQGRFHLTIERPLSARVSQFEVAGETGEQVINLPITAAGMFEGSHRIQRLANAWRVDWVTPGGGVQSTMILDPAA